MSQTININYYDVIETVDVTVTDEVINVNVNIIQSSGAVTSVNGETGTVVLDADDISDTLTTHKFTTAAEATKLAGIEAGAEVNVNADWNATSGNAQILNKPNIPTALPPNGTASGDLQGSYPSPTVHQIQGQSVQNGAPANNDLWIYDATASMWKHIQLASSIITGALGFTPVPTTRTVNAKALSSNITLNTDDISESGSPTNRWWTNARTIASTLTGYASGAGVVAATDTILQAIQKLNGNIAALVTGVSSVNTKTGAVTLVAADISGAAQNLINDGALSTGITGSTSEQPFTTIYTIAAGAVGSNVCANLMTRFTKTGTAGTMRIKLYVNSVASHTNGTQQLIADYSLSAGNVWLPIDRLLTFTGSNLIVSNVANTTATDSVNNTNAATSVTLNTANTWYLIQTVTLGSAADTANRRAIILRF